MMLFLTATGKKPFGGAPVYVAAPPDPMVNGGQLEPRVPNHMMAYDVAATVLSTEKWRSFPKNKT